MYLIIGCYILYIVAVIVALSFMINATRREIPKKDDK
jgi:hypothetical protein